MNLNETIFRLVRSGYGVRFKSFSSFVIEITVTKGCFFVCNHIDATTIDIKDEDLCALLEHMKEEVDWQVLEYRKEKHDGSN